MMVKRKTTRRCAEGLRVWASVCGYSKKVNNLDGLISLLVSLLRDAPVYMVIWLMDKPLKNTSAATRLKSWRFTRRDDPVARHWQAVTRRVGPNKRNLVGWSVRQPGWRRGASGVLGTAGRRCWGGVDGGVVALLVVAMLDDSMLLSL